MGRRGDASRAVPAKKSKKKVGRPGHAAVKAARAGGAKRYDKDMMREARNRVQNGELTIAEAIEEYGPHKVTESTLCRHVRGKSSPSRARGKKPALSPADEDALAEWVITSSLLGFSPTKAQILAKVAKVAAARNITFKGKNGLPGKKWFARWLKAHPEVSKRRKDTLDRMRAGAANADTLKEFLCHFQEGQRRAGCSRR